MLPLKPHDRDTIIQALRAGVVPKIGLPHIQVGRKQEIEELVKDMDRIANGRSAIRFIIGDYGSGKTFFMNLIRLIALEKGLIVMFADLAPDRRIYATGRQARSLYTEMARNLSTRSKPEGGALANVVERFVSTTDQEAKTRDLPTDNVIQEKLAHFEELTHGFDFATVIGRYWEGYNTGDSELKTSALRWLRGEFATRTDARKSLGVRTIIDDANIYDHLKLISAFVCKAGYKGLLVGMDEMVNLYKLSSSQARNANYEQILRILNDVLQGSAQNIGFLMGGTPEFLKGKNGDDRRSLYSYEALQSRLAENSFAKDGLVDMSGPVIQLASLTKEHLFVLLENVRRVMQGDNSPLPDNALEAFMIHCSERIGEAYFRTPRNIIIAFVNLLSVLEQNPKANWSDLLKTTEIPKDQGDDLSDVDEATGAQQNNNEDLTSLKL